MGGKSKIEGVKQCPECMSLLSFKPMSKIESWFCPKCGRHWSELELSRMINNPFFSPESIAEIEKAMPETGMDLDAIGLTIGQTRRVPGDGEETDFSFKCRLLAAMNKHPFYKWEIKL